MQTACEIVGDVTKWKEITKINRNEFIWILETQITFQHAKRKEHQ